MLRYGDAENLSLEQARILLRELAKLSSEDPYFRAEDWSRHPAAGLVRIELKDEILALVSDERTHAHLAFLLLEAMAGSSIAGALTHDLSGIVFDPNRLFGARSRAATVLIAHEAFISPTDAIERLLALGDSDSQRLAFEILNEVGLAVPMKLAVETLLAHAGLTVAPLDRKRRKHLTYISSKLFTALSGPQLHNFLDNLTEYAAPLMRDADHRAKGGVADAARAAVLAALQSGATVTPDQVWNWLRWVRSDEGYDTEKKNVLSLEIEKNVALRHGIQAAALLKVPAEDLWSKAFGLHKIGTGLFPDSADVIALIERLGAQSGGTLNLEFLRELALLDRTRAGVASSVRDAAIKLAGGDPAFIRDFDERSKPVTNEYENKQKRRLAAAEAKRQKIYREIREDHAAHKNEIRAGDFRWLRQTAEVYLGRFSSEFREGDKPEARVEVFLGPELAADALAGFMAALHRNDLPSPTEIADAHAEGRCWNVETVLVCGVAEMVRREIALDSVPRSALDSAYMAWRRQPESNIGGGVEIGPALELLTLANETQAEAFFRVSIEPQLRARLHHIYDLYALTNDPRWSALAGRLAVDWLINNTDLPLATEAELLDAAVGHERRYDLQQLLASSRSRVHSSYEALLEWLAVDFVLDFDRSRQHLADAARDNPKFLWQIRRRAAGGRHEPLVPLTTAQRAFVVEVFGSSWPQAEWPEGTSVGDTNPWDASDFINRMIHSIAAEPTAEATETLQQLLSGAAITYADTLRHALALQRRLRRDHEYAPASIAQIQSVASNALPETVDDMRAYFGDRVATVQARMHATNTDMWEAYWDGSKPRNENFCRNRLVEHISGQLPPSIRFEPEMHMPNQKRADIAAIRERIGLPVEIKGQWHSEVWGAPVEQLAAKHARDWHAEGRGVYIVIWFGNVPRKQLPPHPDGLPPPTTPESLRTMLVDRIPEAMRDLIDVYVVDVTRMR